MRAVLDTNVVISAVFFGGVPRRILSAWSAGRFVLVLSPAMLEEYRRVGHDLRRRHPDLAATFEPILTLMAMNAVIVSGDRDLLRVSGWRAIEVLTPRQFVDRHLRA